MTVCTNEGCHNPPSTTVPPPVGERSPAALDGRRAITAVATTEATGNRGPRTALQVAGTLRRQAHPGEQKALTMLEELKHEVWQGEP